MSQLDELEDIVNELVEENPESVELNKFDYDN